MANAQINGSGTFTDPFNGTLSTGSFTISGEKYINVIIVNGGTSLDTAAGTLKVSRFATVKAISPTSEIVITGYGVIQAGKDDGWGTGESSTGITFTSAESYGHWRGISFSTAATFESKFFWCLIENGSTSGNGGGINCTSMQPRNLAIGYCVIKNNTAVLCGGGIYINGAAQSVFRNRIYNNTARGDGGGMFLGGASNASDIRTSIIHNNSANQGGGIFLASDLGKTLLCDLDLVSNTAVTGTDLYTGGSSLIEFYNTVAWGSNNSVFNSTPHFNNFNYCALQGYSGSGYNSCISLSGNNNDINGPHFVGPEAGNYIITFYSPLRDYGTSTWTHSPPRQGIPDSDILGVNRVGNTDIGTYEYQYRRWKTIGIDTDWEDVGNWEGSELANSMFIVVPTEANMHPVAPARNFTINSNINLIIEPGADVTFNNLVNDGAIWLRSDAGGIASLILASYTGSGTSNIQLYLTGDDSGTGWHYISSPVASVAPALFTAKSSTAVAEYQENLISTDMDNGWVTSLGYHYNSGAIPPWQSGSPTWLNLVAGRGYYYYSATATSTPFNIQGTINTGNITKTLDFNSGGFTPNASQQGFNLVGNPFTCGIDWDLVVSDGSNSGIWSNVESAIYFRRNGVIYTYNGNTTVPADFGNGDEIPPMQGFFIKANSSGNTLTIPAAAKIHTSHGRYKGSEGSSSVPLIRLQLENSGKTDETVIGFNDKATLSFDNLFDARKLFPPADAPCIYSSFEGTKYTINTIPFPESSVSIPLVINASSEGSYTVKATQIEGLENYKTYLLDKKQGFTADLSANKSYSFTSSAEMLSDRFVLTITNIMTGIPENNITDKPFHIYASENIINIQTLSDDWNGRKGNIKVLDLTGRLISLWENIEFSKDEIRQFNAKGTRGIYLVEIKSRKMKHVGRVMIK